MMLRTPRWALLALVALAAGGAARADEELARHVAEQRKRIDDPDRPLTSRERLALDLAATLDRAAQEAPAVAERLRLWTEAAALIDQFNQRYPKHPQLDNFRLQAAVYDWARGRTLITRADLDPADASARKDAIKAIQEAIDRLELLNSNRLSANDLLAQNIRYRLAQALADRAGLMTEDDPSRLLLLEQALHQLSRVTTHPALRGFGELLRAEILTRLDRLDLAEEALKTAEKVSPTASDFELLRARLAILLARKKFGEAIKALDAQGDQPGIAALGVRVRLAERAANEGAARNAAEADAFRRAGKLRDANDPEARRALIELARAVDAPAPTLPADAWDALAEGALLLGDSERAGRLDELGADRAEAAGKAEQARSLRYRAGAIFFRGNHFGRADAVLGRLVDDEQAGEVRPRASLLRILSRSRGLAAKQPWIDRDGYINALERHLREFAADPTVAEVRWLLGNARLEQGRRDDALALWEGIPAESPRRLDAQRAVSGLLRREIDARLDLDDAPTLGKQVGAAREFLDHALATTVEGTDRVELELERIALDLLPLVGRPPAARDESGRLTAEATLADQRRRAALLHVLALAEFGREIEARRQLDDLTDEVRPADLLELARRLDRFAALAEADVDRRRAGQVLRTVLAPLLRRIDELEPAVAAEVRLREARAVLFTGDPRAARELLQRHLSQPEPLTEPYLRDLAETFLEVGFPELAIDAYRLLMNRRPAGDPLWFLARYGLARAHLEAGQTRSARQIVDGTAILHPDLGGPRLRARFERLRERIGPG